MRLPLLSALFATAAFASPLATSFEKRAHFEKRTSDLVWEGNSTLPKVLCVIVFLRLNVRRTDHFPSFLAACTTFNPSPLSTFLLTLVRI